MALLIKRYPNRKLYDTTAKQYITLEGINDLVRQGDEVRIVDHLSGDDLTAIILSQVILENERKRIGNLPHTILAGLIKSGCVSMDALQRDLSNHIEAQVRMNTEIARRINVLVEMGDLAHDQAQQLIRKLTEIDSHIRADVFALPEKIAHSVMGRHSIASRSELHDLAEQLDELSAKLDSYERQVIGDSLNYSNHK